MLNSDIPNRPEKLTVDLAQTDDALFVIFPFKGHIGWVRRCFGIIFVMACMLACFELAFNVVVNGDLCKFLFAILFWAFCCGLMTLMPIVFFGVERLVVTADGIGYESNVIWTLARRFLPRQDIIAIDSTVISTDPKSGANTFAVDIVTTSRKLHFGKFFSASESDWLARTIREATNLPECVATEDKAEILGENEPAKRPFDSDWTLDDDGDALRWHNAGRFNWNCFYFGSCINVFFIGIVSLVVALMVGFEPANQLQNGLEEARWWCLLVILIPTGLVCLLTFTLPLSAVSELFRRSVFSFRRDSMEYHHRWSMLTRTKHFDFDSSCRLVARETTLIQMQTNQSAAQTPLADDRFELALLGKDDVAICSMTGLTIGEARWMKHEIESRRPRWFQV